VYVLGDALSEQLPRIQKGDRCGMLVDLEKDVLRFYHNGRRLEPEIAITVRSGEDKDSLLHAVCLFHSNEVRLNYFGRRAADE
jgi:hypothetical protein